MNINDYKYYYFIGIGGIGMSALARYFQYTNKHVYGYDKTLTPITQKLSDEGIKIHFEDNISHCLKFNKEETLVIYTPAIHKKHSELQYFIDNKFSLIKRSEALAQISNTSTSIAVAGTHGKTTTTAILGHILHCSDLKSTTFVGGILENYKSNFITTGNDYTVVEADEFDRSFLRLKPNFGIITSIDPDHLDIYSSAEDFTQTFQQFAESISNFRLVKKGLDIPNAITYAVEEKADFYSDNIRVKDEKFVFDFFSESQTIKDIHFALPGRHNVENATAAITIAIQLGINQDSIKNAIESFKGIHRRFSIHKLKDNKVIVNDYAHHPSEINATVKAVKNLFPSKKILGVFQPHLFSRTKDFVDDFAKSLNELENLILVDIYPAREEPINGITSEWLSLKLKNKPIVIGNLNYIKKEIQKQEFDVLLIMGAGDIDTIVQPLIDFYEAY